MNKKNDKKKQKNFVVSLLVVFVLTIIAASFSGLLDVSSLSPNTWKMQYYTYNEDQNVRYYVGSPFQIDGTIFASSLPVFRNDEWSHAILSREFVDGDSMTVLNGINAKFLMIPPTSFNKTLEDASMNWKAEYVFSFTDDALLSRSVTGKKSYLLNEKNSQVQVIFDSLFSSDGGVAIEISQGLFTGGETISYVKELKWVPGTNIVTIDLPTSVLGQRIVEVHPFVYVYDMGIGLTTENTGLCYTIDKNNNRICVKKKKVNIPTQIRFGYSVASSLPKTEVGSSEVLYFAEKSDADVSIVNPDDLNIFERIILWIKELLR